MSRTALLDCSLIVNLILGLGWLVERLRVGRITLSLRDLLRILDGAIGEHPAKTKEDCQ